MFCSQLVLHVTFFFFIGALFIYSQHVQECHGAIVLSVISLSCFVLMHRFALTQGQTLSWEKICSDGQKQSGNDESMTWKLLKQCPQPNKFYQHYGLRGCCPSKKLLLQNQHLQACSRPHGQRKHMLGKSLMVRWDKDWGNEDCSAKHGDGSMML